jgi:hypothetical protein
MGSGLGDYEIDALKTVRRRIVSIGKQQVGAKLSTPDPQKKELCWFTWAHTGFLKGHVRSGRKNASMVPTSQTTIQHHRSQCLVQHPNLTEDNTSPNLVVGPFWEGDLRPNSQFPRHADGGPINRRHRQPPGPLSDAPSIA